MIEEDVPKKKPNFLKKWKKYESDSDIKKRSSSLTKSDHSDSGKSDELLSAEDSSSEDGKAKESNLTLKSFCSCLDFRTGLPQVPKD